MKKGIIHSPSDKNLKNFYKSYSQVFTLPEEKETIQGFKQVLRLNNNKNLIKKFGYFQEEIIYLEDKGKIIGAIDFAIYSTPREIQKDFKIKATCHIIYLFVDKNYRARGLGKELVDLAFRESEKLMRSKDIYFFLDQKEPSKMFRKEIIKDEKDSGIKEKERSVWWRKQGFKKLNFRYIQPPLNNNKQPDKELSIYLKTSKKSMSAKIIIEHLYRFFSLSVLKGKDALKNKFFLQQLKELEKQEIRTQ